MTKRVTKISDNEYILDDMEKKDKENKHKNKGWSKLSIDEKLDLIAMVINLIDENGNFV